MKWKVDSMRLGLETVPVPYAGVGEFTFDGKFYYISVFGEARVLKMTENFHLCEEFSTCRVYECLCFDWEECCFWATVAGCASRLFRLDCGFREIACVCLSLPLGGRITGLSCQGCSGSLLLAFPVGAGFYHKETGGFTVLPTVKGMITTALSLCPGYLLLVRRGKKQVLYRYLESGELLGETVFSGEFLVQNMCYNPCCSTARLDFLLREGCYSKVSSVPVTSYELGFLPCICNCKICEYCCTWEGDCCRDMGDCSSGALEAVLTSIALVEASLSHILNAQGEEIQKAVAEDVSVEELLTLNGEINKTIEKVTALEEILCCKLGEVKEITALREESGGDGGDCASGNLPLLL